ncbi:MAG: O-methyltransferase, partial [Sphingobacterium sp.]
PNLALEIGTFTGYATLCLAEGLAQKGVLHTIDINEEQRERVQGFFDQSTFASQIQYHIGDAVDLLPQIGGVFDLVFIDADKKRNLYYFNEVIDRVRPGGMVLVDNVLWKGKIFEDSPDKQTQRVIDVNKILTEDQRVEKLILPIRDGLFLLRKK